MVIETDMTEECEEYGMIIPFSLVKTGNDVVIHAFPWAMNFAREIDARESSRLFTEEFFRAAENALTEQVRLRGYEPDKDYCRQFSRVFRLDPDGEGVNRSVILPSSRRFLWNGDFTCMTETVFDENDSHTAICGTVEDGKLLSFASINASDGEVTDIGTETAENETGKGYAASNTAYLADWLLSEGQSVTYICLDDNPASARVAQKVGFRQHALEYNFVCFRNEDDGLTTEGTGDSHGL